eukprot:scaffold31358_cov26-Tisochrysis_lutea.AAC.1
MLMPPLKGVLASSISQPPSYPPSTISCSFVLLYFAAVPAAIPAAAAVLCIAATPAAIPAAAAA